MTKNAASEDKLGSLHDKVADIFLKILKRYDEDMEVDMETIEDKALAEALSQPNPAMLSAMTKFLKDNDIRFESEKLDSIRDLREKLQNNKKNRGNIVQLNDLDAVGE